MIRLILMSFCLLSVSLVSFAGHNIDPKDWLVVDSIEGITLYQREHQDGLVEIRVDARIRTSFSAFMLMLEDTKRVPRWLHNVNSTQVLAQLSPTENIVYTTFFAPWPATNRDMVTYSSYRSNDAQLILDIQDASTYLPTQPGYIRITNVRSKWVLTKLSGNETLIVYTAFANPNGALPTWLVNDLARDGAIKTFQGLKKEIGHYQSLKHPIINH
ncbi:START domain-containing protein [Vibrio sp. ZSDZ34]|jgi:hypothetical protein|uniref:START domain-containing protein n=1 Tax=Vibrio gelatinilyticus TaxID=2893468 RepID=A0A9X1WCU2_9VIBR|nr:START domain-containing protein [Vibrio gelatinilyticus]MCJ2376793.1 START domain-containing protein [Vibrio gelatinilyticus]